MTDQTNEQTNQPPLSFGQKAVGLTFNPSSGSEIGDLVHRIKQECATAIDTLNNLRNSTTDPDKKRMYSVAITEAQTAQMWAVKAVTWFGEPQPDTSDNSKPEQVITDTQRDGESTQDFQDRMKQPDENGSVPSNG